MATQAIGTADLESKIIALIAEKAAKKDGSVDWKHIDTEIERAGTKITLPALPQDMPIPAAIEALKRKMADEETVLDVHEMIDAFPLDGAVAFVKALRQKYGWANSVPTPGFFGPKPPAMLTVDIGPNPEDKMQVPWGGFQIPGIENAIHTSAAPSPRGSCFIVYGKVKKREAFILKELADLTREIVGRESIYRGKAIRLRADGNLTDFNNPPQFIDAQKARPEELILSRDVQEQIQTNLWTLIEKTAKCKDAKIPLKRGILLEGPYGCGKTLLALVTAKKCNANGWTYILLDRASGLQQALEFAKRYEPAVIFAEDIDRTTEERNEKANDLLNILDGVLSKNAEIMVVLTTNHVEKINQAMLRPGRLDAVISVKAPDAEAVGRLLRVYGTSLIAKTEPMDEISATLAGQIPATVREVVERAKLGAVGRDSDTVSQADLLVAARYMANHLRLLNRPNTQQVTPEERLGIAMADIINTHVGNAIVQGLASQLEVMDKDDDEALNLVTIERAAARMRELVIKASGLVEIKKVANGNGAAA